MRTIYNWRTFSLEAVVVLFALLFAFPLYLTVINAFKSYDQVVLATISLPQKLDLSNFMTVWKQIKFPTAFMNSLIITVCSVSGILLFSSMTAYKLVRSPGWLSSVIFFTVLSAMIVPFQTMMIPLVKVAKDMHLINSIPGIIAVYLGFGTSMALFLFHGFIKGIPLELEDSAKIDGCSPIGVFFRIVFPLLTPITVSVAILKTLQIWNDFLLPLLMLSGKNNQTIPLSYFIYFGEYVNQWHLALAAVVLSVLPVLILYLFSQKYIIQGIMTGAIKG
ncbi:carbohydrate ABC transporter permease [Bacillus sp. FJAT-26390]|uniref:carbohydrate ABC transporter permease n=1 Tax=Bacillus sp. FJAT-26390 TaxID=1743142 RepID=UPI000807C4DB|nr:carbohydrate ABC transporter permease [Bacillus sp. FJAT-26390]OBZ17762.1 sugar ABC transporter permease [Bacillus sp. FJAT-26390]